MKKVALISTWCDTQEKLDILSMNIDKVREKGLDIILISPIKISLPKYIQEKVEFIIYSKENPINTNKFIISNNFNNYYKKLKTVVYDYGFASLTHFKRLLDFAITLEYDEFYLMIYDLNINENFNMIFSSNHTCSFFSSTYHAISGNLMIFNKEKAREFSSFITWDSYFNDEKYGFAENWLKKICGKIEGKLHLIYIEDLIRTNIDNIYYYNNFSIFIQRCKAEQPSALYFYNVIENQQAKLYVDEKEYNFLIRNDSITYIGTEINLHKLQLEINNNIIDLTEEYNKTIFSKIE